MKRITEVKCWCKWCDWQGTIGDTEPGDDGECCCPMCLRRYDEYLQVETEDDEPKG